MTMSSLSLAHTQPVFYGVSSIKVRADADNPEHPDRRRRITGVKLKLKTNLYSAIKSEDSEVLNGGTSQLSSQREYGDIKMF